MGARRPLEERFWEKVSKDGPIRQGMTSPCWTWLASTSGGYGYLGNGTGGLISAHRASWLLHRGKITKCVLHKCDNPSCVNPEHLYEGTQKENADDRERRLRSNHPRGEAHPARRDPSYLARGDDHHMRRRPDLRYFGERNAKAKLTETIVRNIRKEYASGCTKQKELAAKYGITQTQVSSIVRRKHWAHVP
jgi:hypothetical protein